VRGRVGPGPRYWLGKPGISDPKTADLH
jgi:hypothetical protein